MNVTDIQMFKTRTGSLVSGGLLTCRPNTSSWNWSSWTTRLDRDLLVGGSAWMYCAQTHENKLNCAAGCLYQISQRKEISVKTATRIGKWGGDGVTNIANLSFLSLFTKSVVFFYLIIVFKHQRSAQCYSAPDIASVSAARHRANIWIRAASPLAY